MLFSAPVAEGSTFLGIGLKGTHGVDPRRVVVVAFVLVGMLRPAEAGDAAELLFDLIGHAFSFAHFFCLSLIRLDPKIP